MIDKCNGKIRHNIEEYVFTHDSTPTNKWSPFSLIKAFKELKDTTIFSLHLGPNLRSRSKSPKSSSINYDDFDCETHLVASENDSKGSPKTEKATKMQNDDIAISRIAMLYEKQEFTEKKIAQTKYEIRRAAFNECTFRPAILNDKRRVRSNSNSKRKINEASLKKSSEDIDFEKCTFKPQIIKPRGINKSPKKGKLIHAIITIAPGKTIQINVQKGEKAFDIAKKLSQKYQINEKARLILKGLLEKAISLNNGL